MKYLLVLALLLVGTTASADEYFRAPAGSGDYSRLTIDVTINDVAITCVSDWGISLVQFNPSFAYYTPPAVPVSQNSATFEFLWSNTGDFNVEQVVADCDGSQGSLASLEFDGGNQLFSLVENQGTWAGQGIFGATTPLQLTASVADGVRDTGVNIWPLFALIGVALAFVIAGLVVNFIQNSTRERKKMDLFIEKEIRKSKAKSAREQDEIELEYSNSIKKL